MKQITLTLQKGLEILLTKFEMALKKYRVGCTHFLTFLIIFLALYLWFCYSSNTFWICHITHNKLIQMSPLWPAWRGSALFLVLRWLKFHRALSVVHIFGREEVHFSLSVMFALYRNVPSHMFSPGMQLMFIYIIAYFSKQLIHCLVCGEKMSKQKCLVLSDQQSKIQKIFTSNPHFGEAWSRNL